MQICKNCQNPAFEGSHLSSFSSYPGPQEYEIQTEIIYAVPNTGIKKLMNSKKCKGNVVLFNRGDISLVDKVLLAQKAGALGAIIIDTDGQCTDESFTSCGRAGKLSDGGYAKYDGADHWARVEIPSFIVTRLGGQRILNLMHLEVVVIPNLGQQWMNTD